MGIAARAAGHGPPRLNLPNWLLRIGARLGPNLGGLFGLSPNLREILAAADGVTYWASSARAAAELGYRPRDLAVGLRGRLRRREPLSGDRPGLVVHSGPWPATSRCSRRRPTRRTAAHGIGPTCRSPWAAARPASRPRTARWPCGATRTGSGRGCRPARTTTTSRACCAASRSTRSARRPAARTSGSAGTSARPRS